MHRRDRARAAIAVTVVHAVLGYALITGLALDIARGAEDSLKLFDVPAPRPVEIAVPARTRSSEREGAAAPPNLRASPTPVVAPAPVIVIPAPPFVAAPVAGPGTDSTAGAAETAGPGTGGGGAGAGLGSGRFGSGTGGGGGAVSRARRIAGTIVNADYPRAAGKAGAEGTVIARLAIGTDGRVHGCTVTASSGSAELDATTCRLARKRFRYAPARDTAGDPVADVAGWKQVWWIG